MTRLVAVLGYSDPTTAGPPSGRRSPARARRRGGTARTTSSSSPAGREDARLDARGRPHGAHVEDAGARPSRRSPRPHDARQRDRRRACRTQTRRGRGRRSSPRAGTHGGPPRSSVRRSPARHEAALRVVATDEPVTPTPRRCASSHPGRSSPSRARRGAHAASFQVDEDADRSIGHRRWHSHSSPSAVAAATSDGGSDRERGRVASAAPITSWTDELRERHVAVLRHVEPLGGRSPVRRGRRQERN